MATELRVPALGESVSEATVATWFKKPGDRVAVDEMLCELETDKVSVEVPAPAAGVLAEILAPEGATVEGARPRGWKVCGGMIGPSGPASQSGCGPAERAARGGSGRRWNRTTTSPVYRDGALIKRGIWSSTGRHLVAGARGRWTIQSPQLDRQRKGRP